MRTNKFILLFLSCAPPANFLKYLILVCWHAVGHFFPLRQRGILIFSQRRRCSLQVLCSKSHSILVRSTHNAQFIAHPGQNINKRLVEVRKTVFELLPTRTPSEAILAVDEKRSGFGGGKVGRKFRGQMKN
jgi:hypothetical protein